MIDVSSFYRLFQEEKGCQSFQKQFHMIESARRIDFVFG